jgi:hypothetical protein
MSAPNRRRECTDLYVTTEAEEVVHSECTAPRPEGFIHVHQWVEFMREPRCPATMNDYRCGLWIDHNGGHHSRELMFALAGEPL